jgi:non-ribosomal peptide synthase protein (TIGR01720 family)
VPLESLPLTANGKLTRQALPAPTADRVALERTFVAPRTPVEETLARIWCGVLGLERVGIHDNFFELGGDSIMGLQAIARAAAEGLRFTPKQLFQCQTIAELAAAANTTPPVRAEQELVTGPVPLTPIQHWLLESPGPDPHHHNQAVLLEVRDRLEPSVLEVALRHLVVHHDALRLRFQRTESVWQQRIDDPDDASILSSVDLAALPAPEQRAAVEATAARTQASLDLFKGPLIRAVLFDLGADQPGRLLIVVHHLAVDAVSWRILLEDLYAGYEQASRDHAIQLPPKTTSFRYWAEQLGNHARSAAARDEVGYWLAQPWDSVSPLPVDYPQGLDANTAASARTMWLWLSLEETQSLLQEVPRAYNTHINDALLAALLQAFASWTGSETLLVDLEGHGREDLFDDVDLSRTVGWFTNLFPVLLHAGPSSDPGEALRTVKEHLRRVPSRGTGYGVLKYLVGDADVGQQLRRVPRAEVSFTYLGQVAQLFRAGAAFAPLTESSGPLHSPSAPRRYLLDINATVVDGRLGVALTYGEGLHRQETIAALGRAFVAALQALIAHCVAPETGGYTPSDFPDVELTQEKLDAIVAGLEPHDGTPQ